MRHRLFASVLLMFPLPLFAVVTLINTTAHAASIQGPQGIEVVATGLSNPRGSGPGT